MDEEVTRVRRVNLSWRLRAAWQFLLTGVAVLLLFPAAILVFYILVPSDFGAAASIAAWMALTFPVLLLIATLVSLLLTAIALLSQARLASWAFGFLTVPLAFQTVWPAIDMWQMAVRSNVPVSLWSHYAMTFPKHAPTGPMRNVVYGKAGDESELTLDVWSATGSNGGGLRPAFVKVHGGAWVHGARDELADWNRWLNDLGYHVFDIDYRMPPPERWKDEVGDVKCALGWVLANSDTYNVDPKRISIIGNSAGGNLAMLAAYSMGSKELPPTCGATPVPIKSVVNLYGPTNLTVFYASTDSRAFIQGALARYIGGPPSQFPDRYTAVSPITYVQPGIPPTITILGERDRIVPTEQAKSLGEALTAAGVANELYLLPGADHGFDANWGSLGVQFSREKIRVFLQKYG